jgi:predicted CoA-binding protein
VIPPIIVDPNQPAVTNPYYQSTQQVGTYVQLINVFQVNQAFMQIASSLLRISQ